MIDAILLIAVVVMAILLNDARGRIKSLEAKPRDFGAAWPPDKLESAPFAESVVVAAEVPVVLTSEDDVEEPAELHPDEPLPSVEPQKSRGQRFEDIAGAQLPIWIGGIALVFAGFFLVRYSIELGLFGPGARSLLAAGFGLVLLALAEFGPKAPRIGGFVASDPRIAQSLAGAGIATLYGTLYMAAELYGLIGILTAFILVVAVTILALALSSRHGPPTAIMGLVGGYLAPYVAGLPQSSLTSTLLYLGVFTLGLTGLALRRGWGWLALAASAASLVWTGSLIVIAEAGQAGAVGLLVVIAALAAMPALRRAPLPRGLGTRWTLLPLALGGLQLIVILARTDFSVTAWLLYGALAVAAIVMAWRDERAFDGLWTALALALFAVFASLAGKPIAVATVLPVLAIALLFGGSAVARTIGGKSGQWPWVAAVATGLTLFAAIAAAGDATYSPGWALATALAAAPATWVLRNARRTGDAATGAVASAALFALGVAFSGFALPLWLFALALAAIFAALLRWPQAQIRAALPLPGFALAIAGFAILLAAGALVDIPFYAMGGEWRLYPLLPEPFELAVRLALPAAAIGVAAWRWLDDGALRRWALGGAVLALTGFAYVLAKQPLAIADRAAFIDGGFIERAAITQLFLAIGWLLARGGSAAVRITGFALFATGLARFALFDLLLFNPVLVEQRVGTLPLLNAAVIHAVAMAALSWSLARIAACRQLRSEIEFVLRIASALAMVVATLVLVRQGGHGDIIADARVTTGENYLYSAGLLVLALGWLWVGIARGIAFLRIAGLALLTVVTVKVFLVDAAVLTGLLRVVSFLGLGAALIAIGWAYGRIVRAAA